MEFIGCGDSGCTIQRPSGMVTNGGCNCPIVGKRFDKDKVSFEDRIKLRTAFMVLNKELKDLRTKLLIKETEHKNKVSRMETALYNIISNSKQIPQSETDKTNVEVAVRGLSEPGGVAAIYGKLKDI